MSKKKFVFTSLLVLGRFEYMGILIGIVGSYIFGSFVAGASIMAKRFKVDRAHVYGLLLVSLAITLSFVLAQKQVVLGEMIAAFACGLQNGMTTLFSAGLIRTTHLTGISTDIGLLCGQWVKGQREELWKLRVLVILLFSYMAGAFIGACAWSLISSYSFLFPASWCALLAFICFFWVRHNEHVEERQRRCAAQDPEMAQVGLPPSTPTKELEPFLFTSASSSDAKDALKTAFARWHSDSLASVATLGDGSETADVKSSSPPVTGGRTLLVMAVKDATTHVALMNGESPLSQLTSFIDQFTAADPLKPEVITSPV